VLETRELSWLSAFAFVTLNEAGKVIILTKEVRALALQAVNVNKRSWIYVSKQIQEKLMV
jgi:hypothetical protein